MYSEHGMPVYIHMIPSCKQVYIYMWHTDNRFIVDPRSATIRFAIILSLINQTLEDNLFISAVDSCMVSFVVIKIHIQVVYIEPTFVQCLVFSGYRLYTANTECWRKPVLMLGNIKTALGRPTVFVGKYVMAGAVQQ